MLSSYVFNGSGEGFHNPLDKLAYLLDEFEEACWKLKFENSSSSEKDGAQKRPLLLLDDIHTLDLSNQQLRDAVKMLFDAAYKWAREDTAQVVFTVSNSFLETELNSLLRHDQLLAARIYEVAQLSNESAIKFTRDHLSFQLSKEELERIPSTVGSNISDLLRVCEETTKKNKGIQGLQEVLTAELDSAMCTIVNAFSDLNNPHYISRKTSAALASHGLNNGSVVGQHPLLSSIGAIVRKYTTSDLEDKKKLGKLFSLLDSISQTPVEPVKTLHSTLTASKIKIRAKELGVEDYVEVLMDKDVLGVNGLFASDLLRNGYRTYRGLEYGNVGSRGVKKSGWFNFSGDYGR
jgi:hypothetical protein